MYYVIFIPWKSAQWITTIFFYSFFYIGAVSKARPPSVNVALGADMLEGIGGPKVLVEMNISLDKISFPPV